MNLPNIQEWTICDPVPAKNGGKTCALLTKNGEPVCLTLPPLRSLFDCLGYNDPDAMRVNMNLEVDSENNNIVDWCTELDAEILKMCKQHSRRLFGKDIYLDSDLRPMYFSSLKTNEKYGGHILKCKFQKGSGRHAVRIWNAGGLKREAPSSWAGVVVQCRIVIKSIWLQSRSFGLTFEVCDAMITQEDAPQVCPFIVDDSRNSTQ